MMLGFCVFKSMDAITEIKAILRRVSSIGQRPAIVDTPAVAGQEGGASRQFAILNS